MSKDESRKGFETWILEAIADQPDNDVLVERITAIARSCRQGDVTLIAKLEAIRSDLDDAARQQQNHQVRAALLLARNALGTAVVLDVTAAHPDRYAELTTRLKAAWHILSGHSTEAAAIRVLEPGAVGALVHDEIEKYEKDLYSRCADDDERSLVVNHLTKVLATVLLKEPRNELVREALETINFRGGQTENRSKWVVLADLLKAAGIPLRNADTLKQVVYEHRHRT